MHFERCCVCEFIKADAVVNIIANRKPDLSRASKVSSAFSAAAGAQLKQVSTVSSALNSAIFQSCGTNSCFELATVVSSKISITIVPSSFVIDKVEE